ncbi:PRC-barrel domain containing protein [Paraglaciecola aquimarina]|uniref:PRC-barrel domain containing protein n=1 Tax=Paraglaciecola aquimarina TaxID=1235557 RepID=A0ABU3SVB4_9ALTE|nr:PRC-barrel domain containing protein [Paraglaciecola aquimarina]MDU0353965.1 PRC-barrel domain containing protein [Paraglaciecola aquimarina]
MLVSLQELNGSSLSAVDGKMGEVEDIYFDDRNWIIRFLVVDTSPWIPLSQRTLISPIALQEYNPEEHSLEVSISKQKVKDSPKLEERQTVSRQFEISYFDYFGYGYYWMGTKSWGDYAYPTALATSEGQAVDIAVDDNIEQTNHLRSSNEIISYGIDARDGKKGHIKDIIWDTFTWSLRYLVIDTRDWLPGGKKVLVSPDQLTGLSWQDQTVSCNIDLAQIKACPEFDADKLNDPQYLESVRNKLQINS